MACARALLGIGTSPIWDGLRGWRAARRRRSESTRLHALFAAEPRHFIHPLFAIESGLARFFSKKKSYIE